MGDGLGRVDGLGAQANEPLLEQQRIHPGEDSDPAPASGGVDVSRHGAANLVLPGKETESGVRTPRLPGRRAAEGIDESTVCGTRRQRPPGGRERNTNRHSRRWS